MVDFVRRIWSTMFTDKFGMELAWEGINKEKVAIQKSEIFKLITGKLFRNILLLFFELFLGVSILASIHANGKFANAEILSIEKAFIIY